MKLLLALLSIWLSPHLVQANYAPCQPAEFIDSYSVFLKRHLSSDTPASLDHEAWEAYLKHNTDCEESLQSFLSPDHRSYVEDICGSHEGKQHSGNYCISKNKFTFTSVHSEFGTCVVRNVTKVTKHIIVACDMVDGVCRPTHLEENREDLVPWQHDPACGRPDYTMDYYDVVSAAGQLDHGVVMRAAGQLCLSFILLGLALMG